jgi:hypothetical protein
MSNWTDVLAVKSAPEKAKDIVNCLSVEIVKFPHFGPGSVQGLFFATSDSRGSNRQTTYLIDRLSQIRPQRRSALAEWTISLLIPITIICKNPGKNDTAWNCQRHVNTATKVWFCKEGASTATCIWGRAMNLESSVFRILHYLSWLCHRRWEPWELLVIGIIIMILLAPGIRTYRR